jgi:CHAD domain-containing protein
VTDRGTIPAEALHRLLVRRHAVFARAVGEAARSPTPRRVHRSRVAARNLRALLSVLKPCLAPARQARLRRDLRDAAAAFGERREADVRREWMGRLAVSSGALAPGACRELLLQLEREREAATGRLQRRLGSEAFRGRLARIAATLGDPRLVSVDEVPERLLRKRLRRRWKALRRPLAGLERDPAALHALRIAAKKARYASEALAPLLGLDLDHAIKDLRKLQDALGEHRDATEALGWLEQLGEPLGPVLKSRLEAPIERARLRDLKQLERLARRYEVPDLSSRPRVRRARRPARRSPSGVARATPAAGRRAASR